MIRRKVACRQVVLVSRLVVEAVVVLGAVGEEEQFSRTKAMVKPARVSPIEIWCWNARRWLCADRLCKRQASQRLCGDRVCCVFTLALKSEESEVLVLADGTADISSELLALKLRSRFVALLRKIIVGVHIRLGVVKISATVESVCAGLGDDVDGCAFAAAVGGGIPLRGYVEFLDGGKRQLHDRAADSVVLVVDAVHCHVDVSAV